MSEQHPPDWFDSTKPDDHDDRRETGDSMVIERAPLTKKQKLAPPPRYAVIMLNDDFTPMDFVVMLLTKLFKKSQDEAEAIMIEVHKKGKGVAGLYTRDIAEARVHQANAIAQANEHPFKCEMEPVH
jgi:ATP-dependent Clp protease adaptor protein ClpS